MSDISSIDQKQINFFAEASKEWWDENGPFKPLHKINPLRLEFIRQQICDFYKCENTMEGLDILDIGCGGGLVCEAIAELGANVTGLDADAGAIEIARKHAKTRDLDITYTNEDLKDIKQQFDVILALEIIEHVNDISVFIGQCAERLKPEGLIIFSSLNRTAKSFALAIVAAEYVLNWVPKGTHSWDRFIKPSELTRFARTCSLRPINMKGITYNPLKREFSMSEDDYDVNYMMSFKSEN